MKQGQVNKKFIAASVGMMCAISVAAGLAAWPKIRGIVKARTQLAAQAREFDAAREAADAVRQYQLREKADVGERLAVYDAKLPAGHGLPDLLAAVQQACSAAGVSNVMIATLEAEPMDDANGDAVAGQEGRCLRVPITLSGSGDYRSVASMLGNLATGRRLVLVTELTLDKAEAPSSDVVFRASAEAYCFVEEAGNQMRAQAPR